MKKFGFVSSIIIIIALPIIGYVLMIGLESVFPPSSNKDQNSFLYYSIVIAILLIIPYLILKFLFHASHLRNSKEPELRLKDLPKASKIQGKETKRSHP